jgi:transposase
VTRYRRNRGGDRQLNRALHTIVLVRLRIDPDTRASLARRTAEGKSRRDTKRCLRRVIARQPYRLSATTCAPMWWSTWATQPGSWSWTRRAS